MLVFTTSVIYGLNGRGLLKFLEFPGVSPATVAGIFSESTFRERTPPTGKLTTNDESVIKVDSNMSATSLKVPAVVADKTSENRRNSMVIKPGNSI